MSKELPPDILNPLKELITEISGYEEHSEPFRYILKHFTVKLKKSGTTHFVNKRDIDGDINSMCEKFSFHGFARQASALNLAYHSYIPDLLTESEKMNRLSMVKFLLCMSQAPTKHFLEHPEVLVKEAEQPEEVIDWGAYLNEGIEQWNPKFDESSDDESDDSEQDDTAKELVASTTKCLESDGLTQIRSAENMCVMNLKRSREELLATIQNTWYLEDCCFMKPESDHREANIGILWEEYIKETVCDLIPLKEPSIISEYIVIREVLWQLQCLHNSSAFELVQSRIRPRPDVTLASVRSFSFYEYMSEFIIYIELLEFFREFDSLLQNDLTNDKNLISSSYHSYCSGLKKILGPVYRQLCDLEDKVREQECTYTLLNLSDDLRTIFKPVKILKEIHETVILHPHRYNAKTCSVYLITNLHKSLDFIVNKEEQDLKLTLFLNSLYPYLSKTDSWLTKNELCDYTDEFLIKQKIVADQKCVDFEVVEGPQPGSLLNLFFDKVLEIGRNVTFLRQLGKHSFIQVYKDSIYTEFVKQVLEKIRIYNGTKLPEESNLEVEETNSDSIEIENLSVFGPSKTDPNLCKLENMVDLTDGFLMAAFQDFFIKKPPKKEEQLEDTLHQKISNATTFVFPKTNFFESILLGVIERRFSGTGLLVKDLLLNEYFLDKQFAFLKHLFLFDDDLIFPIYKKVFNQANFSHQYRPNNVWLTLQLHDIFSDIYPNFYTKTSVQVEDSPVFVNSLRACDLITINYDISWPLTIIVSPADLQQYNKAFQFVLKIKWALHTLNQLKFSELGAEGGKQHKIKMPTFKNKAVARLVRLKFCLVNLLNSLQHFVFGSVFTKISVEFEDDLSKAQDLNSLIEIHGKFVKSVTEIVSVLQMKMSGKDGSNNILNCVNMLKMMWTDLSLAEYARINCCFIMYQTFLKDVSPVIFPLYKNN